jgi:hypothetical protein
VRPASLDEVSQYQRKMELRATMEQWSVPTACVDGVRVIALERGEIARD